MGVESPKPEPQIDPEKAALNKRLETISWGLLLVMIGGFALIPKGLVHEGWWSIGVGAILLGLNAARYLNHLRMSGFTTILGILSVIGGAVQLFSLPDVEGAFLLIILGAYFIIKPW